MPLIDIRHLTKVFYPARPFGAWLCAPWRRGEPIRALDDVSLTIEPGELVCLMGPNGAGKTTLLRILAQLLLPTAGRARINGQDVHHTSPWLRSQIGFASSDRPGFYDQLTGRQNLAFFASLYGLSRAGASKRIGSLLGQLGLEKAQGQPYQEYSAGMKQRLLLARTLLHDPPILLLDEPTKSLDAAQTATLHQLIKGELHDAQGKTILFTTHQAWEAEGLAGRIAILHGGALRGCGTVEQLAGPRSLQAVIGELCQ
jgi:ABC-type multidrug transport system ATPase subunit